MAEPFRKRSLLTSILPWSTDVIVMQDDMENAFPSERIPQGILLSAKRAEVGIPHSTTASFLQIQEINVNNLQSLASRGRGTGFQQLLRLLTVYRVIDVLAWVGGASLGRVPKFMRLPRIGRLRTQPFPQIKNWVKVLKDAMSDLQDPREALTEVVNINTSAAQTISRLILHGDMAQRLLNLEVAAMHLGYLLKGNADLPAKTSKLLTDISYQAPLDPLDEARIMKDAPTTQPLRLPLHVALFVSPLFLLAPVNLHNRDWDRTSLLQTFRAFGNQKPDVLIKYEKRLWETLYHITTREVNVLTAIQGFFAGVDWRELGDLPREDIIWFETTLDHDIWLSPDVDQVRIEGDLPLGWPLILDDQVQQGRESRASVGSSPPRTDNCDGQSSWPLLDASDAASGRENEALVPSINVEGNAVDANNPAPAAATQEPERISTSGNERTRFLKPLGIAGGRTTSVEDAGVADSDSGSPALNQSNTRDEAILQGADPDDEGEQVLGLSEISQQSNTTQSLGMTGVNLGSELMDISSGEDEDISSVHKRRLGNVDDFVDDEGPGVVGPSKKPRKDKGAGEIGEKDCIKKYSQRRNPKRDVKEKAAIAVTSSNAPAKRTKKLKNQRGIGGPTGHGDDFGQPIDLTKIIGKKWVAYGPRGERHEFQPTMHSENELRKFQNILLSVERSYVGGKPLHISQPQNSAFAIYTAQEFEGLSDFEVQNILRFRHILITNRRSDHVEFGLKALSELRVLSRVGTIQDQSIDVDEDYDYNRRNLQGTMRQVFECASLPSGNGKILNVLDCPMGDGADLKRNSLTSDLHAWQATKGLPDSDRTKSLPGDDIRWGLAALSGALHWFHIDSDGFGTYIDVQTGGKLWIIARPKLYSEGNYKDFSRINLFLPDQFDLSDPCTDNWDLEAVFLERGSRWIMRPNTPHCVYTHGHSICHGGHFYATSCLQDTLFSLIHSFVAGNLVTNTEHQASRLLLRRMIQFYHLALVGGQITPGGSSCEEEASHVPCIDTSEGVLDLFSICILTELSNVLNLLTYSPQGMSTSDREHCIHARHRSRDLLDWFFANYELVRPGTEPPTVVDGKKEVYWPYAVRIVEGLTRYKKLAMDSIQDTIEGCTTASVKKEIEACFRGVAEYHTATSFWGTEPVESLAWPTDDQYKFTVRKLSTPKSRQRDIDGLTADDQMVRMRLKASKVTKNE